MKKRKSKDRAGSKKQVDLLPTQHPEVDRSTYPHKTHATFDSINEYRPALTAKPDDPARCMQAEKSANRVGEHTESDRREQSDFVRKIAARSRKIFRSDAVPKHPLGFQIAHALALVEAGEIVRLETKKFTAFERMARRAKNPSVWIEAVASGKISCAN